MKALYTSIAILVFIISLSVYSALRIINYEKEFNVFLDGVYDNLVDDELEQAEKLIIELSDTWNDEKGFVDIMTRHETVARIDEEISVLVPLLEHKEISLLKVQIFKIKKLLNNLVNDEMPMLSKLV